VDRGVELNAAAIAMLNHVRQRIALAILQTRNQPALKIMNTSALALFSVDSKRYFSLKSLFEFLNWNFINIQ
jgi:hypothetical protein